MAPEGTLPWGAGRGSRIVLPFPVSLLFLSGALTRSPGTSSHAGYQSGSWKTMPSPFRSCRLLCHPISGVLWKQFIPLVGSASPRPPWLGHRRCCVGNAPEGKSRQDVQGWAWLSMVCVKLRTDQNPSQKLPARQGCWLVCVSFQVLPAPLVPPPLFPKHSGQS